MVWCLSTSESLVPELIEENASFQICMQRSNERKETLYYRVDTDARLDGDGTHFDGDLLYRNQVAGTGKVLWASNFHSIVLDGLLEVHSPTLIESLVVEEGQCHMTLARNGEPNGLTYSANEDLRVVVNGRLFPAG